MSRSPWRALILSTGYKKVDDARKLMAQALDHAGFESVGYELPGYPVDYTRHAHETCLLAVPGCDFAVALLDGDPGGRLAINELSVQARRRVEEDGALDLLADGFVPTILQAEVLRARSEGLPVVVLCSRIFEQAINAERKRISASLTSLTPRGSGSPPDPETLAMERRWWDLHRHYRLTDGTDDHFGQVAFLEHLRRTTPNWITFFDPTADGLLDALVPAVNGLQRHFADPHRWLPRLMRRSRNVLNPLPLTDLRSLGGLVEPPLRAESGELLGGYSAVAERLLARDNVLLLGGPGAGKSTWALMTVDDLANRLVEAVDARPIILANMSTVQPPCTAEELVRNTIGHLNGHEPWPSAAGAVEDDIVVVLEALDEWAGSANDIAALLRDLEGRSTILASSRGLLSDRRLRDTRQAFDVVAVMEQWDRSRIQRYADFLDRQGNERAAAWIGASATRAERAYLGIPLWLSMIAFLLRPEGDLSDLDADHSDEEIVELCAQAVVDDHLTKSPSRQEMGAHELEDHLRDTARAIQRARMGQAAHPPLPTEPGLADLTRGLFRGDNRITGFFHEVFYEYWLAQAYIESFRRSGTDPQTALELLDLPRTPMTNRLIRHLVRSSESGIEMTRTLIELFDRASASSEFKRNQIVYFIARFNTSKDSERFLRGVFEDEDEEIFVRLSAAFGAMHNGDTRVRDALIDLLMDSEDWAAINGGYHLFYYGDYRQSAWSSSTRDDGTVDAEATVKRLIERISRSSERAEIFRPVELLTLQQLLKRRPDRVSPALASEAQGLMDGGI